MKTHTDVRNPKHMVMPTEVEGFDSLAELALDVHWSWNHATDGLWRTLDPVLWDLTQILGSSCRRSRGTNSSACWLILPSARTLTTGFDPSVRRRRVLHGSNKSIRKLH